MAHVRIDWRGLFLEPDVRGPGLKMDRLEILDRRELGRESDSCWGSDSGCAGR
jgi:hypothetical protein